jgi:hypothetical protein
MKLRTAGLGLLAVLFSTGAARAVTHLEGGISLVGTTGQWVTVCPLPGSTCYKINLYSGTRMTSVPPGKKAALAAGEYVSLDARPLSSGQLVATEITVFPTRFVRVVKNFKKSNLARIESTLKKLHGVQSARVVPSDADSSAEAVITFAPGATNPAAIEKLAARKGIVLTLASQV